MPKKQLSPLYMQAADALGRARRLPVGPYRNDLRQLALGLRRLEKNGFIAQGAGRNVSSPGIAQGATVVQSNSHDR
jgi:hypothetical protein